MHRRALDIGPAEIFHHRAGRFSKVDRQALVDGFGLGAEGYQECGGQSAQVDWKIHRFSAIGDAIVAGLRPSAGDFMVSKLLRIGSLKTLTNVTRFSIVPNSTARAPNTREPAIILS